MVVCTGTAGRNFSGVHHARCRWHARLSLRSPRFRSLPGQVGRGEESRRIMRECPHVCRGCGLESTSCNHLWSQRHSLGHKHPGHLPAVLCQRGIYAMRTWHLVCPQAACMQRLAHLGSRTCTVSGAGQPEHASSIRSF